MKFALNIAIVGLLCICTSFAIAQSSSNNSIKTLGIPFESDDWIQFKTDLRLPAMSVLSDHKKEMGLGASDDMQLVNTRTDHLGFTRHHYQQRHRDIPVEFAVYNIHSRDGIAIKGNGKIATNVNVNPQPTLSSEDAMTQAIACIGAESYYWENASLEAAKKNVTGDPDATFYPTPELLIVDKDFDQSNEAEYRLAWKFEIYSSTPDGHFWVYVDANNGHITKELSLDIHNSGTPGTAVTRYAGTHEIITDSTENGFVLRDDTRGRGVETYDAQDSFVVANAIDFFDEDNFWDHHNDRADDAATDAHWAAEMLYDYLRDAHGRDSYDNLGSKLVSYIHVGENWRNARWNGLWGEFGDAGGEPWTFVDVMGHEFGHGVTWATSGLIYARESGALNESFSDLLGESLQDFVFDSVDWLSTPAPVDTIRSMIFPNDYNDPDTYLGENWVSDESDNYGVHSNSGVQNHWFYLISEGGTGTNDNGANYTVEAIGIQTAMTIIMRSMETYLTPSSGYYDARQGALFSAEDLFGACSFEYQQVANAWHAVGVGPRQDANDFSVIDVDNFELCEVGDAEFVTMYIKYMGCDSSGPVTLDLKMLKTNSVTVRKETLNVEEGFAPGEVMAFTFAEEFNFSKHGEHFLTGSVDYASDPYEENNSSEPVIVKKPAPVSDQLFTFYTNFAPRTFRDTMAFYTTASIDVDILANIGTDSTTGILVNGDDVRFSVGRPIPEGEDLFDYNEKLAGQICFCVDATELDSLGFQFDLRMTYSSFVEDVVDYEQPPTSAMRVLVDGIEHSRYLPKTNNQDAWETHNIDLEEELGNTFTLCLETRTIMSKLTTHDTIGDHVYLDNIAFVSSLVETSIRSIPHTLPLNIYPNPTQASTFVEFDVEEAGDANLILRNINGQTMQQKRTSVAPGINTVELELGNFAPGIYLIEVRTDRGMHLGKIVVQ